MNILENFLEEKRSEMKMVTTLDYTYERRLQMAEEARQEMEKQMEGKLTDKEDQSIELGKERDDTELSNWIRLFNADSEEDLDMIRTQNPGLLEAIRQVRLMSMGKRMRLRYEAHLKEVRDRNAREDYVREEGFRQGIEQKLLSQIERKLAKGQTEEQIAEDLLEPVDRIRKLRKKIR